MANNRLSGANPLILGPLGPDTYRTEGITKLCEALKESAVTGLR